MMEPVTREEKFLASLTGESVTLPDPITRKEMFLAAAAGMTVNVPDPITREEKYLSQIKPGDGSGVTIRNQNKTITENGTYKADPGYTGLGTVTVAVPAPDCPAPVLEPLTVTENGEYTPGEGVDGFNRVTVEVAGEIPERTAWYRPPDWPDYSSLNLPEDEGYVFYTFDTAIPVADELKKASFSWYLYNNSSRVNIDRGHIADGAFVSDERVLPEGPISGQATFDLPADAGRFVVYRIAATDPSDCVRKLYTKLTNPNQPCVETFAWCGGFSTAPLRASENTTVHTMLYTVHGCITDGGTYEFWSNNVSSPYAVVYDDIKGNDWGYMPFINLGKACKALYITNSVWPMRANAQLQFSGASGLIVLDFTGSTITATSLANCFSGCSGVHKLDLSGWIMSGVANLSNAFKGMTALVDLILPEMPPVSFALNDSTLLSVDSLVGAIAALPVLADGATATLTLGATNTAKLTADQIAVATEKGWTVA